MRPISEKNYNIPPERVVGSSYAVAEFQDQRRQTGDSSGQPKTQFSSTTRRANRWVSMSTSAVRPILAFGNADSDMQMIEYTMAGEGRRLGLFVHHTDADREYAYDRKSHVGTLDKALDRADANGWIIVDMKKDWKGIFPGK